MYREKPRINYQHSDGMDDSPLSGGEIEEKELEKILLYHYNKYLKKHKLGAKLEKLIHKTGIQSYISGWI